MRYFILTLFVPALLSCTQAEDSGPDTPVSSVPDQASSSAAPAQDAAPPRTGEPGLVGSPPANLCNAQASWVGKQDTPQQRRAIEAEAGHGNIRFITPDTMVTEDFSLDRLNIRIDAQGTITGANCG